MLYSSSLFVFFLVGISLLCGSTSADLTFKVERIIDLSTQFTDEETYYEISNQGNSPVASFELGIRKENLSHWFVNKVTEYGSNQGQTEKLTSIQQEIIRVETHNEIEYNIVQVTFKNPLSVGKEITVKLRTIHTHEMEPKPKKMTQKDLQQMLFKGNLYPGLGVNAARTAIQVRCMQVISYSEEFQPVSVNEERQLITFGPYFDIPAWSYDEFYVHIFNTAQFITVDSLVREVEISHWGNVAVEESYILHNSGTPLTGTYSRLDYMMQQTGNSIPKFVQHLPQGAHEIYYRDIIGNISTSHVSKRDDFVMFEVIPRFVLFGGWRDEFKIGYNLPPNPYLTLKDDDLYVLRIPFINNFDNAVLDDVTINIILPEGAFDIDVSSGVDFFDEQVSTRQTYLDTVGRVVTSIKARNLVSEHRYHSLIVSYRFESSGMVREPLFLIASFCCFFLAVIIYFRTNITIHDKSSLEDEKELKINKLAEDFLAVIKQRDAKCNQPISGKNFSKKISQLNTDMNTSYTKSQSILSKLANLDSEISFRARAVEQASKAKFVAFRALQNAKEKKSKVEEANESFIDASDNLKQEISKFRSSLE